jgi:regulator of protease activity HflC (stomatin/prohibitin superfamily)
MSDQSFIQDPSDWLARADQLARLKVHRRRGGLRSLGAVMAWLIAGGTGLLLLAGHEQRGGLDLVLVALLVPAIGLGAAILVATKFYQTVLNIKDYQRALDLVRLCLFGLSPFKDDSSPVESSDELPLPYIIVKEGQLDAKSKLSPLTAIGGSGILIVFNDSAVVLENLQEQRGPMWRVVLPGSAFIEQFERIESIIDLRRQVRTITARNLTTLDGIPVDIDVTVSFQIKLEREPDLKTPYPASPAAVLQAAKGEAYFKAKAGKTINEREFYWHTRINGSIDSTLKPIVSQFRLDELIDFKLNSNPRQVLYKQMYRKMSAGAERYGAVILDIKFGEIKVPEAVSQQWIDSWQSVWESQAEVVQGRGKAERHRQIERAHAQAQQEMLTSLTDALATVKDAPGGRVGRLIALRFIEWMSRESTDIIMNDYGFLPQEALNTLQSIRTMLGGSSS